MYTSEYGGIMTQIIFGYENKKNIYNTNKPYASNISIYIMYLHYLYLYKSRSHSKAKNCKYLKTTIPTYSLL